MFNHSKVYLFLILSAGLLVACGESDAPEEELTESAIEISAVQLPAEDPDMTVVEALEIDVVEEMPIEREINYLPNQVIYQEEIYANWPYTEAPPTEEAVSETAEPGVKANPQTHTINAEARVFKPDTIYVNPGDTVGWTNMTSHNTVSIEGLIPEGATSWASKLGQNLKVTLDVEGIYAYVCQPHIGFGMVGLIVVGKPANLEEVKAFARDNLQGPFRRIIGKLNKVKIP